jgi:hypothetical protein
MHPGWGVVFVAGAAALGRSVAQQETPLPLAVHAQAISRVLMARPVVFRDDAKVDACSIYLVLDRDPRFTERLSTTAREMAGPVDPGACAHPGHGLQKQDGETWWRLDSVRRASRGRVIVSAVVEQVPSHSHREETTFSIDGSNLVLREFRVSELIDSDSYPQTAPPR